jgi:hypothetical protein
MVLSLSKSGGKIPPPRQKRRALLNFAASRIFFLLHPSLPQANNPTLTTTTMSDNEAEAKPEGEGSEQLTIRVKDQVSAKWLCGAMAALVCRLLGIRCGGREAALFPVVCVRQASVHWTVHGKYLWQEIRYF